MEKMKKRMMVSVLAAVLVWLAVVPAAYALQTNIASGTCGDGINWSLDGYTLTISGSGEMAEGAPWAEHKNHVEHIVFTGGVTKICDGAFSGFDRVKTVEFGDSLVEIGTRAFYGCKRIDYIHLPATFRIFGKEAFRDCEDLKYVYCDGGMPRFNDSCLWTGQYIAVFYPTNNPWPQEPVSQLISNFGGRLGIMMGNFDVSAVEANLAELEAAAAEEAGQSQTVTEAPTQAPTEPATVPPTEPPTIPTTVPPTQPATVPPQTTAPVTEPPTVPTTEAPETTAAARETEPEETKRVGGDGWIGIVLIAVVLTMIVVGALIFRGISHRDGDYRE